MPDDVKLHLKTTYSIRGSSTKRDHADDSLASSRLHNERDQHRHDTFEHSEDAEPEETAAPPKPADQKPPAESDDQNGIGGVLDVEA